MPSLKTIFSKIKYRNHVDSPNDFYHEFCPRCEANITLQKGYDNSLPYWVCKGCGEMLINPEIDGDIIWICDKCDATLNIQKGFDSSIGEWTCTECGFCNKTTSSEIYTTNDEYNSSLSNPYKGMIDSDVIELLKYEEICNIENHTNIYLVKDPETDRLFIKKILEIYDASVYRFLMNTSVPNMPHIYGVYEGSNNLIVIEDYIEGETVEEILSKDVILPDKAIHIAREVSSILKYLHSLEHPIIHRDIKPSNIIVSKDDKVYLLDMNVAKWYREGEAEDTRFLGTLYYAAPEQMGYGFTSSSEKTDIYAIGILLNVMITGKLPKEEKAVGDIWKIIEKCICLDPAGRYTDSELINALDDLTR